MFQSNQRAPQAPARRHHADGRRVRSDDAHRRRGGFFVIMGIAFFVNGLFDRSRDDYPPGDQRPTSPASPTPTESPRQD